MSRTIRKMHNQVYRDGKYAKGLYYCNCSYCMGVDKRKLEEKIRVREMKKEIKEIKIGI